MSDTNPSPRQHEREREHRPPTNPSSPSRGRIRVPVRLPPFAIPSASTTSTSDKNAQGASQRKQPGRLGPQRLIFLTESANGRITKSALLPPPGSLPEDAKKPFLRRDAEGRPILRTGRVWGGAGENSGEALESLEDGDGEGGGEDGAAGGNERELRRRSSLQGPSSYGMRKMYEDVGISVSETGLMADAGGGVVLDGGLEKSDEKGDGRERPYYMRPSYTGVEKKDEEVAETERPYYLRPSYPQGVQPPSKVEEVETPYYVLPSYEGTQVDQLPTSVPERERPYYMRPSYTGAKRKDGEVSETERPYYMRPSYTQDAQLQPSVPETSTSYYMPPSYPPRVDKLPLAVPAPTGSPTLSNPSSSVLGTGVPNYMRPYYPPVYQQFAPAPIAKPEAPVPSQAPSATPKETGAPYYMRPSYAEEVNFSPDAPSSRPDAPIPFQPLSSVPDNLPGNSTLYYMRPSYPPVNSPPSDIPNPTPIPTPSTPSPSLEKQIQHLLLRVMLLRCSLLSLPLFDKTDGTNVVPEAHFVKIRYLMKEQGIPIAKSLSQGMGKVIEREREESEEELCYYWLRRAERGLGLEEGEGVRVDGGVEAEGER